ncbi:putative germin-like protein 9-2 [Mangifera indica]|uniref:putative germin-like protein 9-2 n=1 Tax=Mangifera indica TaxID=29780 RepID=UPI001CFA81FE|nr:putative germin-like protein 9-2 [Mangifera indica]
MSSQKLFALLLSLATVQMAFSGDSDILTDFLLPPKVTRVDSNFFTFTRMRALVGAPPPTNYTVTTASLPEFPALNGQSVSYAVLQFPAGTSSPLHEHPRSGEVLFLVKGHLTVGFVDTTDKLFVQKLQKGDMFLFPKGLVHFQYNRGKTSATAISAFGSVNPGTESLPNTLFTTGIDDTILAKSFKTDIATIKRLKAGLAPKP